MSDDPMSDNKVLSGPVRTLNDLLTALRLVMQASEDEAPMVPAAALADFGYYEGLPPMTSWLPGGRAMRLEKPITYHRPDKSIWPVPAGIEIDGASIPPVLWSLIGGPFEGKYRDASIIHDHACDTRTRPWRDTHRMFYDGMRCSGVGDIKAGILFYAVYRFGPRWPDPALEAIPADGIGQANIIGQALTDNAVQSLRLDVEAIIKHGLGGDEIAALAEARSRASSFAAGALEAVEESPDDARARLLVIAGGSGSADDIEAVAAHAVHLPAFVVDRFLARDIRIIACRSSVTDFETDLRGQIPRGWEKTGKTWDDVPGCYFDERRRVVVATVDAAGARIVPDKNSGLHGSDNLVIHESLHGYDYSEKHTVLAADSFVSARDADIPGLTTYENQAGQAGLEETFAETGAQHCIRPDALSARCPNLAQFWATMPVSSEAPIAALETPPAPGPLGIVKRTPDGALHFDLRATGSGGAIGHGFFTIGVEEPHHGALAGALFGGLESVGEDEVLFFE